LCEKLNENPPEKSIDNLGEWWEVDRHCKASLAELNTASTPQSLI